MKIFDFDALSLADTYRRLDWLHVPSGVTAEFLDYARDVARSCGASDALQGPAIKGAKNQYVFDFPKDSDWETELFDLVAELSGLRRETLTLSERHLKAYLPDADPRPPAHKDRFASGIALGITLEVGVDSHVVLYPDDDRAVNPHLTAGLRDGLAPDEQPEVTLQGAREVAIHDAPGDVLAFPGASIWHLRRNAAGTVLLYLKLNDLGCDPLGEDPTTDIRRQQTLALLADPAGFRRAFPVLSRRFDSVGHETGRVPGRSTWHVNVWEGDERRAIPVPERHATLVGALDDTMPVGEQADQGAAGLVGDELLDAVRLLAARGALDLRLGESS